MDYDVIVVGGGGAGIAAAIAAQAEGASCIVLEADRKLGGAAALSTGIFYAAGTSVQRQAGIPDDTPEAMYYYLMTINQWGSNPKLVRALCDDSGSAFEWLRELGADFPVDRLVKSGVDDVPRGHGCAEMGLGIVNAMTNRLGAKNIEVAYGTRLESLNWENGRVVGVQAGGYSLRSSNVVLATGGFANNRSLVERFYPTAASHGDYAFSVYRDVPYNVGDGLLQAEAIGANIAGFDTGLCNATASFGKIMEAFIPPWVMLVNLQGRRFMAETISAYINGYLINEQAERRSFAILDQRSFDDADANAEISHYKGIGPSGVWNGAMLREQLRRGGVKTAQTIAELAQVLGIDTETLTETVARYNANCQAGHDPDFFKKATTWYPVSTPPFYAVEVRACVVGSIHAGLEIDEKAHVLSRTGRAIPGLFSAGEVAATQLGRRYAGGGIGLCNAIVFGLRAGRFAAREAIELA